MQKITKSCDRGTLGRNARGEAMNGVGSMGAVRHGAESPDVTDDVEEESRGAAIKRRLKALGISDREFTATTGVDRKTLNRAIANDEATRASTYLAIEAAIDKMEARVRGLPVAQAEDDYVEFTVEGNFGVRAVVKGPVKDMDELQRAVARLVREMRGDDDLA